MAVGQRSGCGSRGIEKKSGEEWPSTQQEAARLEPCKCMTIASTSRAARTATQRVVHVLEWSSIGNGVTEYKFSSASGPRWRGEAQMLVLRLAIGSVVTSLS